MSTLNLSFDLLFKKAISDLPMQIDFGELIASQEDLENNRYLVSGFEDINGVHLDDISRIYSGAVDEVLMRTLHWAIFISLHGCAKFSLSLRVEHIRKETVKSRFESDLDYLLQEQNSPGWQEKDLLIIREYFKQMKKSL